MDSTIIRTFFYALRDDMQIWSDLMRCQDIIYNFQLLFWLFNHMHQNWSWSLIIGSVRQRLPKLHLASWLSSRATNGQIGHPSFFSSQGSAYIIEYILPSCPDQSQQKARLFTLFFSFKNEPMFSAQAKLKGRIKKVCIFYFLSIFQFLGLNVTFPIRNQILVWLFLIFFKEALF